MKRVFVTGGAGYVGSHVCLELLCSNHQVMVFDNLVNGSKEALRRVELLSKRKLNLVIGDVRNQAALESAILTFKPESIIHFAGLKAVSQSVSNPMLYYDVNIRGSLNLLDCMAKVCCNEIIFSSSATVYGELTQPPYSEKDYVSPKSPYGRTKQVFENILQDWVHASDANRAISLRYFNPVGAHKSGLIGESPQDLPNNLMPLIVRVAQENNGCLDIYGADYETRDGTGERDYIHVCDLANAHVEAVEKIKNLGRFQILNLGTGRGTTVKELIETFEKSNNVIVPVRITDRRPGDVAKSYADPTLANNLLNFQCKRTIREMCVDAWNWAKKNPNGYQE